MRVGPPLSTTGWLALRVAQQTLVQAASHASQPTAKPVTEPDRIETSPGSRAVRKSVLDIRV